MALEVSDSRILTPSSFQSGKVYYFSTTPQQNLGTLIYDQSDSLSSSFKSASVEPWNSAVISAHYMYLTIKMSQKLSTFFSLAFIG